MRPGSRRNAISRIAILAALASATAVAQPAPTETPRAESRESTAPPTPTESHERTGPTETPATPGARAEGEPGVIVPPRIVHAVDPTYPAARLAEHTHPSVIFLVIVDRDGAVATAEVEHSAGADFDAAAYDALLQWRFEPATRDGVAIASRVRVAVHFALPEVDVPATEAHAHDVESTDGAPLDPARDTRDVASEAETESAPVEGATGDEELVARASVSASPLRNEGRAISEFRVDAETLALAPHRDAGQLLEAAPGFVVTRPEGDAIAHRILLRGFDAEHGQDIELTVEGLPMNQPSHLHGQGYADLGFLVPEVVRSVRVVEGVYDPSQGDFAVAGSADFDLGTSRRGITAISQMGSFRTFREALIVAPEDEPDETFLALQTRRTSGFGTHRASLSASGIGQWGFGTGPWHYRVLGTVAGARADLAGVVRRDDLDTVGFYGAYDDPSARAQNAFSSRALLAFLGDRRGANGATSDFAMFVGFTDFRSQTNFTGYVQRSELDPSSPARGDLVEQTNRASTVGMRMRHRSARFTPTSWLAGTLEVGSSMRIDRTSQSLSLLAEPHNEVWDRRIDATIVGTDVGGWLDADLDFGPLVSLRGGVRADALLYDVEDALGNRVPGDTRDPALLGYHRTAYGLAAGPRASLDVHPGHGVSFIAAYGEGYRSPQAIELEDAQRAPYTKVRSADLGAALDRELGEVSIRVSASGFFTRLSDDLVFEADEGRFERIGASRRVGAVVATTLDAWRLLRASASITGVRATLRDPPPGGTDPAFRRGSLVPFAPPVVVRADLGAHHAIGNVHADPIELAVGAGFSYVGRRPLPYGERAAAFALLDAQATVSFRAFSVGVSGQNLLGMRYAASESLFVSNWNPDAPASRIPARSISAGAPRTLLFTVTVNP